MKNKFLVLLSLLLILTVGCILVACDKENDKTDETSAEEIVTTVEDVTTAQETTAEETTAEETTVEETTVAEETTLAEETTEAPTDPALALIKVGKSYDGKTDCYDGRYQFEEYGWVYFKTKYGEYYCLQEAIDDLEGEGGNISMETYGDTGICLSAVFPDDGCDYHLYYNYNNCDFVFNYGLTFDDDSDPHGYCYYSSIDLFDSMNRADLDGHHIFIWTNVEGYAPGYYELEFVGDGEATGGMNYNYHKLGELAEYWPGLPDGETYFED